MQTDPFIGKTIVGVAQDWVNDNSASIQKQLAVDPTKLNDALFETWWEGFVLGRVYQTKHVRGCNENLND